MHVAEGNPRICAANEQYDDWWMGFVQGVEAYTLICDLYGHFERFSKR